MAVDAPKAFQSNPRDARRHESPTWRLPSHHALDIGDVARGVEETNAGVCTRYLVDHAASTSRPDIDADGYIHHLEPVERFCERHDVWRSPLEPNWRMRILRCRRALAWMRSRGAHTDVAVLFVSYGQPDPILRDVLPLLAEMLGERWPVCPLASLARYTDPVEGRRVELVRGEATAHADACITSTDALRDAFAPFDEEPPTAIRGEPAQVFGARVAARTLRRHAYEAKREAFALDVKQAAARVLRHAEQRYHHAWLGVSR